MSGRQRTETQDKVAQTICELVPPGARVLDVGCGDGLLLDMLVSQTGVRAQGLEISRAGVLACVAKGLSVVQGDAETDLVEYPDNSFDYVILTQTIQAMKQPLVVLQQSLRIATRAIVSMPNFAHWRLRLMLLAGGRMPRSGSLPAQWFETDNIHLCTILDFIDLCARHHITIEQAFACGLGRAPKPFNPARAGGENLLAHEALFVLSAHR